MVLTATCHVHYDSWVDIDCNLFTIIWHSKQKILGKWPLINSAYSNQTAVILCSSLDEKSAVGANMIPTVNEIALLILFKFK